MSTKDINSLALASLTTGTALCSFSEIHGAAEQVMGHEIWTHQFPALLDDIRKAALEQYPALPTDVGKGGWEACRDEVLRVFGPTVPVQRGNRPPVGPLDHLPAKFGGPHET